ncbi:E3 ubiquitin-protein ligase FANCL-like [Lytechinus pictus]|uniref:E3 ubiquitin-protein ligase FANCL-like n=1 Tax=Lytechinus pictus TaxID=7653 RepID=UPI0030BA1D2D
MTELGNWSILVPQNLEKTIWTGLIQNEGEEYQLKIEFPKDKNIKHASVQGDWRLARRLGKVQGTLENRLRSAVDPEAFMQEVCNLFENTKASKIGNPSHGVVDNSPLHRRLVEELETLGWDMVTHLEPDLSQFELTCNYSSDKTHNIAVQVHSEHPSNTPVCTNIEKDYFKLHWTPKLHLDDVLTKFEGFLLKYGSFWEEMAEIDNNTWVLEPEKPGPMDVSRRIALGSNFSIQIEVDPLHPRMLPKCRFLGADNVINPVRKLLNTNLHAWNSQSSLLTNLRNVLEVDFPTPAESQVQDFKEECGICYSYSLDAVIPDQVCDNPHCNKPFHQTCLYEWLRALPSSYQSITGVGFNILYGECPYCTKQISVKKIKDR